MEKPEVSVIMATYNRSNIIHYAIASLIAQTFLDWELIVVGDCCTDDTESVVKNLRDGRIRFINLPENFGEQSGPNNEGLRLARGKYIAFLNHDDLWFADHLQIGLECLTMSNADLVFAGGVVDHGNEKPMDVTGLIFREKGYNPDVTFVPASNWIFKRELIEEVGYWKPAKELYLIPSYDWQQRVYQAGKRIVATEKITVIAVPSSSRVNSYLHRSFTENQKYFNQLQDPSFRGYLLNKVIFDWGQVYYYDEKLYLKRFFMNSLKRGLRFFGVNVRELSFRLRFGKGGIIRNYRQRRGLK
jgi:glycosyltransferase involved in cell wall biosynthesis